MSQLITKAEFMALLGFKDDKFGGYSSRESFPKPIKTDAGTFWHKEQAMQYAGIIELTLKKKRINSYLNVCNQLALIYRLAFNYATKSSEIYSSFNENTSEAEWEKTFSDMEREMGSGFYAIQKKTSVAQASIINSEKVAEMLADSSTGKAMRKTIDDFKGLHEVIFSECKAFLRPVSQIAGGFIPNEPWAYPREVNDETIAAFIIGTNNKAAADKEIADKFRKTLSTLSGRSNTYGKMIREIETDIKAKQKEYDVWLALNETEIEIVRRKMAPGQPKQPERIFLPEHPTLIQRFAIWILKKTLKD